MEPSIRVPRYFDEIVDKKHRFVTFFPLSAAIRRKIFFIVGMQMYLLRLKSFPLSVLEQLVKIESGNVVALGGNKEWMMET